MRDINPMLAHTKRTTTAVHDALILWVTQLLQSANLESVDVFGRFPPEGTIRSHLVLFPYRVGPEPKSVENATGASMMSHRELPSDKVGKIPPAWRELGRTMLDAVNLVFPQAGRVDGPGDGPGMPYPRVQDLPPPLRAWYEAQDPEEDPATSFLVIDHEGTVYAKPPSMHWKPGISVWAHYIAVSGDPGRGVSDRTSDAPPLALAALSVLTVGIQNDRVVHVEVPAQPWPSELKNYVNAMVETLRLQDDLDSAELVEKFDSILPVLDRTDTYQFGVIPVHDLSMHEFSLLTQALQRPLQAVLNFRVAFELGSTPVFMPAAMVSFRHARRGGGGR